MRIGFPRALMFYRYSPFLKAFLEECGYEVYITPPTNLDILSMGTEACVDDICVAVKVFFGHVCAMAGEVDAILLPRIVSVERRSYSTFTCPKLTAAPDMIRFSLPDLPPLLEFTVDVQRVPWWLAIVRLGWRLGISPMRMARAYLRANQEQTRWEMMLRTGLLPEDALARLNGGNGTSADTPGYMRDGDVAVAVVGHPYLLGDALVNQRLVHWLEISGARVMPSTMLEGLDLRDSIPHPLPLSWSFERELMEAAAYFLSLDGVDGLIYLTSFGCGPDSIMMEMIRRELPLAHGRHIMELVLDEHSVESAVRTRAEAFVDLLRRRKIGAA